MTRTHLSSRHVYLALGLAFGTGCPGGGGAGSDTDVGDTETGGASTGGATTDDPTGGSSDTDDPPPVNPSGRCEQSRLGARVLRRLSQVELEHTLRDIFPEIEATWSGVQLGIDPASKHGFTNDAATLLVGDQTAAEWLATAEDVGDAVTAPAVLPLILPCAAQSPDSACAAEFIDKYGQRLFRRPLTADERARYASHFAAIAAEVEFPVALKWTLVGLIQSPHAVYRSELGEPGDDGYALTPYEVATALAYTYGGSTPSPELLAKAEQGALATPEARMAEAGALLSTPRGKDVLHLFFRQWAKYPQVESKVKIDVATFDDIRMRMIDETRRFVDEVVFAQEGDVRALLTAPITVLDATLSQFYGFGQVAGDSAVVERPADWGVGLLAQGSVLAGQAHADSSSPTKRGLLVYDRLLCGPHIPPPMNIPAIDPPMPGAQTTRERYEVAHAGDPACQSCHQYFDPIGFGFEHFDAAGRFRADENGLPIDATGQAVDSMLTPLIQFDGLTDLANKLAELPQTTDCVSGLLTNFAYGVEENCLAEEARTALQDGEVGLREFYVQLAASEHFVRREE
ncbi:Protein of unknown function [Nannocystis exedens]|uniref:Cellulose-binding domain protein n=1 Tax=Nannocystis exedens TaxID=54 RepID=A0A1I2F8T5_9BACT|nr:DUF1588 domain-containing protein [Nannocystis exedens]PCC73020.1 hypothetical protein NAEX_06106 [Nannocystis exedens]SFF01359.1 Protein of unknown function [Nannocystis exedens]